MSLWLEPRRVTEDLDLVAVSERGDERLRLLDLAADLGLPVEALNSAADFFVYRIDGWRDDLEILHRGARGTVYRPSPTLFLLLKIRRLSFRDLDDCRSLLRRVRADGLPLDRARVLAAIEALPPAGEAPVSERRRELIEAIEEDDGQVRA